MSFHTFDSEALERTISDRSLRDHCRRHELLLLTANRNHEEDDSLEAVLRSESSSDALPAVTLADPERIMNDKSYAERTAQSLLEHLFDIDRYRGVGRLYLP